MEAAIPATMAEICIRRSQPHSLMTSYNLINGIHAPERADLIGDVLRSEFGFEGIVMTDWTIAGMGPKNSPHPEARADRISAAGVDLVMPGAFMTQNRPLSDF